MSTKPSKSLDSRKSSAFKMKEERDENYCEAIFLALFNSLDEEITTVDELLLLLQYAGCNPSKKGLAKYWDDNTTESYTFSQFCSILKQEEKTSKEDLMKAFTKIDRNGDGFITHDELFEILTKKGERMTKAEVKVMIADADFNGDGKLDYLEFCSMMNATTRQVQQFHFSKSSKNKDHLKKSIVNDEKRSASSCNSNSKKAPELKKGSLLKNDSKASSFLRKTSTNSTATKKTSSSHSSVTELKNKNEDQVRNQSMLTSEPNDLTKWQYESSKGCFHKEEDGSISSHQFQLKVTQPTSVWITIKACSPKYGKFNEGILDSDMAVFLVEYTSGKLISFSDAIIDEKICLYADVDIGVYNIYTFSSGIKLLMEDSESGKVALAKGVGDECRLTKLCKDSLMEIFYRSDLDGNGFLNRKEFNEFQKRSSGEECDDEAWEVVKESVDLNPHEEITLKGFLDLNLMEVRDPDGGQDELWVTLESLGYSNKLHLTGACPFFLEVCTRKGQNKLLVVGISDGGMKLYNAVLESIRIVSNTKPIKNKRDLHLHIATFVNRTSIAVDNQSHCSVKVQIDCSSSENLISDRGMDVTTDVDSKTMTVIHHLLADNKDLPTKLKCHEAILRS